MGLRGGATLSRCLLLRFAQYPGSRNFFARGNHVDIAFRFSFLGATPGGATLGVRLVWPDAAILCKVQRRQGAIGDKEPLQWELGAISGIGPKRASRIADDLT